MICEICRESKVDRIIAESKKAMERYTKKLKEEKNVRRKNNKKNEKI
mgnify:CR=1 FL=1